MVQTVEQLRAPAAAACFSLVSSLARRQRQLFRARRRCTVANRIGSIRSPSLCALPPTRVALGGERSTHAALASKQSIDDALTHWSDRRLIRISSLCSCTLLSHRQSPLSHHSTTLIALLDTTRTCIPPSLSTHQSRTSAALARRRRPRCRTAVLLRSTCRSWPRSRRPICACAATCGRDRFQSCSTSHRTKSRAWRTRHRSQSVDTIASL